MGELREWWANVYGPPGDAIVSVVPHKSRSEAAKWGEGTPKRTGCVHVRLKPEGAPARYASAGERLVWQNDPDWARGVLRSRSHEVAERMMESRAGQLLRTQKSEEAA